VTGEDLEGIGVPVYAGLAENDQMVPKSLPRELKDWAAKYHVDLTLDTYPEVKHGFAARPEAKDPKDKEQYEQAFIRAEAFFRSHQ
jgi:dienelactone hydrolase